MNVKDFAITTTYMIPWTRKFRAISFGKGNISCEISIDH